MVHMNRAVGRCSARMRQRPRQVFLFPLPSSPPGQVQRTARENRQNKAKTTQSSPRTGRGQSFVLLAPPFPSTFPTFSKTSSNFCLLQEDLSCLVLFCLVPCALPVLPLCCYCCCCCCCCQHAESTHHKRTPRQHCPQLPNQLPNLCTSQQGRRANAAPSPVELQRPSSRSVTRPAKLSNR